MILRCPLCLCELVDASDGISKTCCCTYVVEYAPYTIPKGKCKISGSVNGELFERDATPEECETLDKHEPMSTRLKPPAKAQAPGARECALEWYLKIEREQFGEGIDPFKAGYPAAVVPYIMETMYAMPKRSTPNDIHVIEKSAYEALERELAELKAKPATFIKLDENTEAFAQTRAAIENMKQFQKDALYYREQMEHIRADRNVAEKERDQARAELAEAKTDLKILVDNKSDLDLMNHKLRKQSAALVEAVELGLKTIDKIYNYSHENADIYDREWRAKHPAFDSGFCQNFWRASEQHILSTASYFKSLAREALKKYGGGE